MKKQSVNDWISARRQRGKSVAGGSFCAPDESQLPPGNVGKIKQKTWRERMAEIKIPQRTIAEIMAEPLPGQPDGVCPKCWTNGHYQPFGHNGKDCPRCNKKPIKININLYKNLKSGMSPERKKEIEHEERIIRGRKRTIRI